jgi:hypothetical protein
MSWRVWMPRRNHQPGDFGQHRVARAGALRGDDGNSCGCRFQHDIRETLAPGGQNQQVHGTIIRRRVGHKSRAVDLGMAQNAHPETWIDRIFSDVKPTYQQ